MVISIDFDDTICDDKYPQIGELLPHAVEVINYWHSRGHEIIINSCRTGDMEKLMRDALRYHEIKFDWINKNSPRLIRKYGTDTRKISCDLHIDDRNFFIKRDMYLEGRSVVLDGVWELLDSSMSFMEKPLVICIVGESGSGKTLLANYMQYNYGVNIIESYTDREPRTNNEGGYKFLSPRQMDKTLERTILTSTTFGKHRYCGLMDDVEHANVYIVTEDGAKEMEDKWGKVLDIYSVRLYRDKEMRIKSVGAERVARDKDHFVMPKEYFDWCIMNTTDNKELLFHEADDFIKKFRLKNRFDEYKTLIIDEEND